MKTIRFPEMCSILFALLFPTLLTWVYFVLLDRWAVEWQQGAYLLGKSIQFAWPLIWVFGVDKRMFAWRWPNAEGLGWGLGFGMLVAGHALILYFGYLQHASFMTDVALNVQAKAKSLGLNTPLRFLVLGIFYSLVHSFLEEYYWRWFVFRELRRYGTLPTAVGTSSFFFALHHVLLLAMFFGWQSPWTWLLAAAVGVGGVVWALIYARSDSLLGPWISHMLIDATIFAIGFHLAQPAMS